MSSPAAPRVENVARVWCNPPMALRVTWMAWMRRGMRGVAAGFVLLPLLADPGQAEDYPRRTVKVIVPYPAGGTADLMPRIVFDWLSRKWGQAGDRKQGRWWRQHRRRGGVQCRARRLHPIGDVAAAACHQPEPLSAPWLRRVSVRAGFRAGRRAECARRKSRARSPLRPLRISSVMRAPIRARSRRRPRAMAPPPISPRRCSR